MSGFKIDNHKLYRLDGTDEHLVITRDEFCECYMAWILHNYHEGTKTITNAQAANMIRAYLDCTEKHMNDHCYLHDCEECDLCYEQGTAGEFRQSLLLAIDALRKCASEDESHE